MKKHQSNENNETVVIIRRTLSGFCQLYIELWVDVRQTINQEIHQTCTKMWWSFLM